MNDLASFGIWWLIVTLFGLAAWPVLFRVLRFLPDRGYSLARTGGLLAIGYVGWLLGNAGLVRVDGGGVLSSLFIVGVIGVVCARGQGLAMREWLHSNRLTALIVVVVFLMAFALWAYVRALNPNITATEKPMEFGFLNSVLRSGLQPPGDPWLAGYAISYYHFGYVIMGMMTALSGVQPSVAFNLGIALLFGLTAVGAFGAVLNMIALAAAARHEPNELQPPGTETSGAGRWLRRAIIPALLGPLFMLLGNFNGVLEVAHKAGLFAVSPDQAQALALCPPDNRYCVICKAAAAEQCGKTAYANNFWGWMDIKWTDNPPGVAVANEASSTGFMPDRFLWWWQSSRVIHDRTLFGDEVEVIDEFPFFSFLLGDMHPHVLGLPFVFLAIAFGLSTFAAAVAGLEKKTIAFSRPVSWDTIAGILPLSLMDILAGAVILGGLSFLNTWDFPIYTFVVSLAYVTGRAVRSGWTSTLWRDGAVMGGTLAIVSVVLYLPFYIGFRSQLGGLLPNVVFGSRIQQFVVMFGPALSILAVVLGWYLFHYRTESDWKSGGVWSLSLLAGLVGVCAVLALSIVSLTAVRPEAQAAIDSIIGRGTPIQDALGLILTRRLEIERLLTPLLLCLMIGAGVAVLAGSLRPTDTIVVSSEETTGALPEPRPFGNRRLVPFMLVLVITGALLALGPEFVYLRDLFSTRMNTVFKFYYQAWVMWSLASAFGAWWLWQEFGPTGRVLLTGLTGVVVAMGLIYPVLSTSTITDNWQGTAHNDQGQPYATLDGIAYMKQSAVGDYEAIKFLNISVGGRPVVAEAVGGSYSEYARISAHTGLPTILGWPFHELQWRGGGDAFAGREDDVRKLYTSNSWDETRAILDKYRVTYIYVGQREQTLYEPLALEKFDRNLSKIYNNQGVVIYEYKGG
jgi:YYY domain-containing protein